MTFEITEKEDGEIKILELRGELDSSSVAVFKMRFAEIAEKHGPKKYILDMKGLMFISSAGWSAFLNEYKQLRSSGGDLKFAAMNAEANRVYELVGISNVIESYDTLKEAVKSYA